MQTTQTVELLLDKFPVAARKAYRVPNISNNLVAVSELCDAGCTVYFHKEGVEIEYEGEIIGRGWRDKATRLWRVPLTSEGGDRITPPTAPSEYDPSSGIVFHAKINSIYECENKEQLTKYYHASLGSHPKSTLIEAANSNYLRGCPGLDATAIRKFIAVEDATEMGHMKQIQQGIRSTKTKSNRGRPAKLKQEREAASQDAISIPEQVPGNEKTHEVYMTTMQAEGLVASDQTGMLPRTSNRGMKYLCIFYIYDPNFIKGIPIKSRKKEELLRAYKEVYKWCEQRGYKPRLHKLDNETSKDVEDFIATQNAKLQYTPPDMHRTNPAERGLQTYKSCGKSILASVPPNFPIALWCRLAPLIDFCVNIVRKCRQNPLLSTWAAMEGEYHFDATPIAPPGSEMLLHEKPNRRKSWGFNAKKAWYLGPCFQHYRSFRGLLPSTGGERISDTVRFKHHAITIPQLTPADRILEAAKQLEAAIKQQPKKAPMDEITAIELLRSVLLGEQVEPLPKNSIQKRKMQQAAAAKPPITKVNNQATSETQTISPPIESDRTQTISDGTKVSFEDSPAYISDDEEDGEEPSNHRSR